jgi:hypothetical protein
MKKIIAVVMTLSFLLFSCVNLYAAAGSWSAVTYGDATVAQVGNIKTFSITFTASADNATIPNYTISTALTPTLMNYMKGFWIYTVQTDPGSTGPTAAYDIVINDVHGMDIMGGALADRSATATENVFPKFNQSSASYAPLDGTTLVIAVSNNLVNSATSTLKFFLSK